MRLGRPRGYKRQLGEVQVIAYADNKDLRVSRVQHIYCGDKPLRIQRVAVRHDNDNKAAAAVAGARSHQPRLHQRQRMARVSGLAHKGHAGQRLLQAGRVAERKCVKVKGDLAIGGEPDGSNSKGKGSVLMRE
jgi:hypothetical protein